MPRTPAHAMRTPVGRRTMDRPRRPQGMGNEQAPKTPSLEATRGGVGKDVHRQIPGILRIGGTRRRNTVRKRAVDPNIQTVRPQSPQETRPRVLRLAPRSTEETVPPAAPRAVPPRAVTHSPTTRPTTRRGAPALLAPADALLTATPALRVAPPPTSRPPRRPRTLKPKIPSTPIGPITWPSTTPKTRNCAA